MQVFVHVMSQSSFYKSDFFDRKQNQGCVISIKSCLIIVKKKDLKKPTRNINHIPAHFSLALPINPGSGNYSESFKAFLSVIE